MNYLLPATLTVPNLPDELHCWLSEQAAKPTMSPDQIIAITARCKALPDHDTRSPDEIIAYDESGILSC